MTTPKFSAKQLLRTLNEASPEQIDRDLGRLFDQLDIHDTGGALYLLGGMVERKLKSAGHASKASRVRRAFDEIETIFNDIINKR